MKLKQMGKMASKALLILSVSVLFTIIVLFAVNASMSANSHDEPNNEQELQALPGLPDDAEVLSSRVVSLYGESHPLGLGVDKDGNPNPPKPGLASLYEYVSAQSTTYLVPRAGVIVHFTYEFVDAAHAEEAYTTMLRDEFLAGAPVRSGEELGLASTKGTFIVWQDPDAGDQAYWHISTGENVLVLLLVNGMPSRELKTLFQGLMLAE